MTTWSAMPSSSAGPDTAGPSTTITVGHHAGAGGEGPGRLAPAVERGEAFADVGAGGGELDDHGSRSSSAARAASAMVSPSRGDSAPALSVRPTRTSTTDRCPCTVSRVSIAAWTMPGTLARSCTVRPPPGTRRSFDGSWAA